MSNEQQGISIEESLQQRFGPLIGGIDLRNTLGYKSATTFNRAVRLNQVGLHVFEIPNRRGKFALTRDVAVWLANLNKSKSSSTATSVRLRHKKLYDRIHKRFPEHEVLFIREAFINYGIENEQGIMLNRQFLRNTSIKVERKSGYGVYELAKMQGVMPSTIRARVKQGIYKAEYVNFGKTRRLKISLDSITPLLENNDGDVGLRDASKFVGLPQRVLSGLREKGVYQIKHRTEKLKTWAIPDLRNLVESIICQASGIPGADCGDLIQIRAVMRMIFRSESVKSEIIAGIIDGRIRCFGSGQLIPDLLVSKSEVIRFADSAKSKESDYLPVREFADITGCNKAAVGSLIQDGFLTTKTANGLTLLERKSVDEFHQKYVPLSVMLKPSGGNSQVCIRLCNENGIHVLRAKEKSRDAYQAFVLREDQKKILKLMS